MELPKINSIRKVDLNINTKKVTIRPWSNIELTNFDSLKDKNRLDSDLIYKHLIEPYISTSSTLTLQERRHVLIELYKLSKGKTIDIQFDCSKCEQIEIPYQVNIDESIKVSTLKNRDIKTNECKFMLKHYSNYIMKLDEDINRESVKYMCSYISSFIYKDTEIEPTTLDELTEWFITELPREDFDSFMSQMNDNVPTIDSIVTMTCPMCGHKQEMNLRIEDFLA